MTDAECAETLAEFRKLTLGPELSAALDHAIGWMTRVDQMGTVVPPYFPAVRVTDHGSGGSITGGIYDGVLMNSRAIDLAAA